MVMLEVSCAGNRVEFVGDCVVCPVVFLEAEVFARGGVAPPLRGSSAGEARCWAAKRAAALAGRIL